MACLELRSIKKDYEGQALLQGVSFTLEVGEILCLLGPSGSGKSTLLRIIAGLENADSGSILWEGNDLAGVPVHKRDFGLMFQDYALFPHRTVGENVAFGLRMKKLSAVEIKQQVQQALEQVEMSDFTNRRIGELSGGEQQRVALARSLAPRPRLLMLDEPLGALDRNLRAQLTEDLHRLLHQTGIPAIYVTHDQEEAFAIGDRIALLHDGTILQIGTPEEVYAKPITAWVARFFGLTNLIEGTITKDGLVHTVYGVFEQNNNGSMRNECKKVMLLLRPSGAKETLQTKDKNVIKGEVIDCIFRGEDYLVRFVTTAGDHLDFYLPQTYAPGRIVTLEIKSNAILCLPDIS